MSALVRRFVDAREASGSCMKEVCCTGSVVYLDGFLLRCLVRIIMSMKLDE